MSLSPSSTLLPSVPSSTSNIFGAGNGSTILSTSPTGSLSTTFTQNSTLPFKPTPTSSLNCQQNIPTNGPAATDIANALRGSNQLATVCAAKFNGSSTTFNYDYIDMTLERSSPGLPLAFCNAALNSIINTCILGSNYYGGVFYQGGETYNISNSIYPKNPLNIGQGAPSPDNPSRPTTTTQSTPPGPTGFSIVALSCSNQCDHEEGYFPAVEVVPSADNSCDKIVNNSGHYVGDAYPGLPVSTQINAPSLLDYDVFTIYAGRPTGPVLNVTSNICGLGNLNITFTRTSSGYGISYLTSHTFLLFS
jgi:hypothetical protein